MRKFDGFYALTNRKKTLLFTRKLDCIFYQAEHPKQRYRYREVTKTIGNDMIKNKEGVLV